MRRSSPTNGMSSEGAASLKFCINFTGAGAFSVEETRGEKGVAGSVDVMREESPCDVLRSDLCAFLPSLSTVFSPQNSTTQNTP